MLDTSVLARKRERRYFAQFGQDIQESALKLVVPGITNGGPAPSGIGP